MSELDLDRPVPAGENTPAGDLQPEQASAAAPPAENEVSEQLETAPASAVETAQPSAADTTTTTDASTDGAAQTEGPDAARPAEHPTAGDADPAATGSAETGQTESVAGPDTAENAATGEVGQFGETAEAGGTGGPSASEPAEPVDEGTALAADTHGAEAVEVGSAPAPVQVVESPPAPDPALEAINAQLVALAAALGPVEQLKTSVAELTRLRGRDTDLIDRLHEDNTRLRAGELAAATAPLLQGLVRLHDQMTSIAGGDQHSVAGMLRTQLLQLLEVAAGVTSYEPAQGDPFDPSRHTGAARAATNDPSLDNTVGRQLRPGFTRADGSILRVAEVEVLRHTPAATTSPSTEQKESQ